MKKTRTLSDAKLPETFDELVRLYPPRAIRDGVDYRNAQEWIDRLTGLPSLTLGQDEYLDTLATLFHAYEEQHHSLITADLGPVDTLKFLMAENGMTASDLGRLLCDRAGSAKILNGKRDLSKDQIRLLAEHFKVSPGLFF